MIKSASQLAFVIGLMLLCVLTLTPANDIPEVGAYDKLCHAGAFLLLALCGRVAFPSRRAFWYTLLGLAAVGAAIELAQTLVPGRDSEVMDQVADVVGTIIGLGLGEMLRRPLVRLWSGATIR